MKSFFKIFKILTPKQMRFAALLIVLMVFCAAMEAIGIGVLYPLIAIINNENILEQYPKAKPIVDFLGITSHKQLILDFSLGIVIFYIIKNALVLFQNKIQIKFSTNNQKDYCKRLYTYYMNKPYLFHVNTNISIISRNVSSGASFVFSDILINTLGIITECITIFVIWSFIVIMDWLLAVVIAFILGPIIFLILNYFRRIVVKEGAIQNKYSAEYGKWLNQGFFSIKETKVMQREAYFMQQFSKSYDKFADSTAKFLFANKIPKTIIEMLCIGGIIVLVAVKILMNVDPKSMIPTLGVLALAAVRLMPSINKIVGLYNTNKFKMPLFNEIFDDLLSVKENKDKEERKIFQKSSQILPFEKNIEVKNLSFTYPEKNNLVLDNVSFKIPKGGFVGIVGPSGAGKTTFVDILLGLLNPKTGSIYVDDADIFSNLSGWLLNVAYVPQSIYLIDGTISENVAFGIPEAEVDKERVKKVIEMAELKDFVDALPEKENTSVGDRGARLSGGQRQRIGIARALYHDPSVLVLDEATSALDNETEKSITETIIKLKGSITIIAIAHRLTTLENCDFKIKFDNGKASLIERGEE
ncbi:MAG: ABC transporter ATP-binding protein/permease [Treponema sp.]|nr:ABC transporter ATP-binding protein/permease [Treponema sp.]